MRGIEGINEKGKIERTRRERCCEWDEKKERGE